MDLSSRYLGLTLPHPLMVGASPLVDDLDLVKRAEDAGTAAIVMHSLFEEQITDEELHHHHHVQTHAETHAEALSFLPEPPGVEYALGPDEYLEQIRRIKDAVSVPVIGSLNGATPGGWTSYAKKIQDAGADALELNVYYMPTELDETGEQVEQRAVEIVQSVADDVSIPVSVKLSHFFSSIPNVAKKLSAAGADGLIVEVHFNPAEALSDKDQTMDPPMFTRAAKKIRRLRAFMENLDKDNKVKKK